MKHRRRTGLFAALATGTVIAVVVGVALAAAHCLSHDATTLPTWIEALATLAAVGAVVAAWLQLGAAREAARQQSEQAAQTALEQARPYVLLTVDVNANHLSMFDLVLQNVGAGPAYEVVIEVDPPFVRAKEVAGEEFADARLFARPIPMLPPHYELRSWFDDARERLEHDELPDLHEVTISYHDGHGHPWCERTTLDLSVPNGLLFPTVYGVHHLAEAARGIHDKLAKSPMLQGTVDATIETREERAARAQRELEERRAAQGRLREAQEQARARASETVAGPSPTIAEPPADHDDRG